MNKQSMTTGRSTQQSIESGLAKLKQKQSAKKIDIFKEMVKDLKEGAIRMK